MSSRKRKTQGIRDINVIDIILIDHRFLKECIEVFTSDGPKEQKLEMAKSFLEAIQKHSEAEKEIIYDPLEGDEEFHFNILEAEIEHGIVDEKVWQLRPKLARAKQLKDEVEAELKVLAELLQQHLKEEESELLPKMNLEIDEQTLKEMGEAFMQARRMTNRDLKDFPLLQDELIHWKDNVQRVSSQFLSKMDKYVENLKH